MSSIIKLTQQLSKLSQELLLAQDRDDTEEVERIEELMYDISDELDELNDFYEKQSYT